LALSDATEATRIALAITRSLRSGQPEAVGEHEQSVQQPGLGRRAASA
jgi:hypothetical protein